MDEIITLAGGVNATGEAEGWFEISEENIIAANPDVILYTDDVVDEANQENIGTAGLRSAAAGIRSKPSRTIRSYPWMRIC